MRASPGRWRDHGSRASPEGYQGKNRRQPSRPPSAHTAGPRMNRIAARLGLAVALVYVLAIVAARF
jgi:hypothetical protein